MEKVKTGCFILFYIILALIVYFTGFDLMEVFAVKLWGYEYPINYSYIQYKKYPDGSAIYNLSDGVNNSNTFAVGITSQIQYSPYWLLSVPQLTYGHTYHLSFPVCTMDAGTGPETITHFSVMGSSDTSGRTLLNYNVAYQDSSPYVATTGPVTALTGCGTLEVTFDYIDSSTPVPNSLSYLMVTSTASGGAKRWVTWGFNLEDLGTSASYVKFQADRIISSIGGSVLNDIDSNVNDINSNLGYDGSQSDISNPNDSNLQEYLSNQNDLLNDSNIQDFDFSDYSINGDIDLSSGITYVMNFINLLILYLPLLSLVIGVALTLGIVALLLNRK